MDQRNLILNLLHIVCLIPQGPVPSETTDRRLGRDTTLASKVNVLYLEI